MADPTQRLDPNRTMLTPPLAGADPLRTQAMGAFDPLKTSAMQPSGPALTAEIVPGRDCAMANGPAREQYLVEFMAAGAGSPVGGFGMGARTPLNLCLVIDRSGSMEGPPLDYCKQACAHVVDLQADKAALQHL